MNKIPILVIVGPTATGKSDLSVKLAKKLGGEVISADSRQVYRGLNIGTGKITKADMKDIPHHLLDVADPRTTFTVAQYVEVAKKAISDIHARGKLPVICGGTGFYIQALVDGIIIPDVPPNPALRKKLEKKNAAQLFVILKKIDLRRAVQLKNSSDWKNPRRLIRAIEIATELGKVPVLKMNNASYSPVFIGITAPLDALRRRIITRLKRRLADGMLEEALHLHSPRSVRNPYGGVTWKRMESLGLEYRWMAQYHQNIVSKQEMIQKLDTEIGRYARRQMTWFKRDRRIRWTKPGQMPKLPRSLIG